MISSIDVTIGASIGSFSAQVDTNFREKVTLKVVKVTIEVIAIPVTVKPLFFKKVILFFIFFDLTLIADAECWLFVSPISI